MARLLRVLFEVEREFVRTATTLIYRVGEPELKYLLCQHIWESSSHARFLRERSRRMGIIMVTASGDTIDQVVGLETGADDYIAKPYEPRAAPCWPASRPCCAGPVAPTPRRRRRAYAWASACSTCNRGG